MEATRIIAVRHGETAWNVDCAHPGPAGHRLERHRPLAGAAGRRSALADGADQRRLFQRPWRAHDTAQPIGQAAGIPVVAHEGLRERSFGMFEGKTFDEIQREPGPTTRSSWRKRIPEWQPPEGGESLLQLRERVTRTVNDLASRHSGEQIVVVAHGGVLDALYRVATGQEVNSPRTWELPNGAINRLLWTPEGFTLVGWSDTQHLDHEALDENTSF